MGLFKNKIADEKTNIYPDLITEINNCKSEDLEAILQKIESELEKKGKKDKLLLSAKTMVTSKIALKNSSK